MLSFRYKRSSLAVQDEGKPAVIHSQKTKVLLPRNFPGSHASSLHVLCLPHATVYNMPHVLAR